MTMTMADTAGDSYQTDIAEQKIIARIIQTGRQFVSDRKDRCTCANAEDR